MTRSATQKRRIHTEVPEAAVLTASAEVGMANTSSSEKQPRLGAASAPKPGAGAYRAVFACASLSQERPARKGES